MIVIVVILMIIIIRNFFFVLKYFVVSFKSRNSNNLLEPVDIVDSQRQQAEERAQKMKSVLVKTKKELSEAKKQVRCRPDEMPVFFLSSSNERRALSPEQPTSRS